MSFSFAPFLPLPALVALGLVAALIAAFGFYRSLRGTTIRFLAFLALIAALANPQLQFEDRAPLSTVVPVIVDQSQSQTDIPAREKMTEEALKGLKERLARFPGIEPRIVTVKTPEDSDAPSTRLFSALTSAISDVPPARVGAAILITDGEVHDVPASIKSLGIDAPIHTLLTGKADEFDRRITLVRAPRFGIVGQPQTVTVKVIDEGMKQNGTGPVTVTVRINGDAAGTILATPGVETPYSFTVPRAGSNIVEFSVAALPGEVSAINNKTVALVDGIRQNLRVLLVSGEPHAGERAWRNLLKSDPSVDLVHFTILRPPEKQDGTPINELSLIAFPTRELFVEKIRQFDLIILDRYQNRGVLPLLYYDNIANYVREGGALLVAAGPELASDDSIAMTPLSSVLPALPTGTISTGGFYPRLSEIGKKHPVTRDLPGASFEPPHWGRWFRSIDVDKPQGETVMNASDGKPLLILNRVGKGRVAMLLSDQGWLWARGFEGGGPHVALYRRIAHWLMKEPELEEEALTAKASGHLLTVTRQTIGGDPGPATITTPSGKTETLPLQQTEPGRYSGAEKMHDTGLFTVTNGTLSTLVHVGAVDAPEFKAMISTPSLLQPVADASHGLIKRLDDGHGGVTLPDILPVNGPVRTSDGERLTIRMTSETILKGIDTLPLFAGFGGLALLLFALSAMWWREGR
ncbi:hypothetical protein NAC44_02470 [Allorhizobium sp. BGMRC 0089]|uniref:hypothetical protein n=1 Tax=Allorhizobium sonneratiae TaxID=2934936 RepID=UPI002033D931|nr:hypothetical protein [Allorhizobium sonneratiae]MCM2291193.1 hypothetical protein [Allorhizobium sonneratiae]